MGLFDFVGDLFGGRDSSGAIQTGGQQQLDFMQQGLDYLQGIDAPAVAARGEALPLLSGFYTGDPQAQQDIVSRAQASPFYDEMVRSGQQGVLRNAGAMGLTRSGNTAQDLSQSNQAVLQQLVNQQLAGLGGLANLPTQGANIAQLFSGMGEVAGGTTRAAEQDRQSATGTGLGAITGLIGGLFSDERLKEDIKYIGDDNGHGIYSWKWNDLAQNKFGLKGKSTGVIAQKIQEYAPHLIKEIDGFLIVDYRKLGVNHG